MTNPADFQYLEALDNILHRGVRVGGRNGHSVLKLFGTQLRFDMSQGFPLLTSKKLHAKSIITELLWFIRGGTNVDYLHQHGVTIWDEWADANGDLGPVYGSQWRSWPNPDHDPFTDDMKRLPIDQLKNVLASLKIDPFGRRHIVTAWNPAEIDKMALPPCHMMFQFNVRPGMVAGKMEMILDLQMYQRSADWFLGVPFNIASYALLLHLVARHVGYLPGEFVHSFGDYHLYTNHVSQAKEQIARREDTPALPRLSINPSAGDIFELEPEDITFDGYNPMPAIKAEVAV